MESFNMLWYAALVHYLLLQLQPIAKTLSCTKNSILSLPKDIIICLKKHGTNTSLQLHYNTHTCRYFFMKV